jgi:cytochrome c oxidase subunit IV
MNGITTSQAAWIRPCTRIWLLLMALSLVTFLVGWLQLQGLVAALTVLGFALLKGLLIGDYYMGLRWVDGLWRWVVVLWLLVPGALITFAFVLAARGGA